MRKEIKFLDEDRNKVTIDICINEGKFSMSGQVGGSSGQILDSISPATESQERLLELWDKYHLNDMKPGTPRQMKLVEGLSYDDAKDKLLSVHRETGEKISGANFERLLIEANKKLQSLRDWAKNTPLEQLMEQVYFDEEGNELEKPTTYFETELNKLLADAKIADEGLKSTMLYDTLEDGTLYQYGTSWLTEELPEDIEDIVEELCDTIEEEEEERKGESLVSDFDIEEIKEELEEIDSDIERVYAIASLFELSLTELEDIDIDDTRICVQGTDYLFGTDEEMDQKWDESLDNYLEECIYPELSDNMVRYFDDDAWKRDARMDGRAHSLNYYDGGEEEIEVNNVTYYAYRQ